MLMRLAGEHVPRVHVESALNFSTEGGSHNVVCAEDSSSTLPRAAMHFWCPIRLQLHHVWRRKYPWRRCSTTLDAAPKSGGHTSGGGVRQQEMQPRSCHLSTLN